MCSSPQPAATLRLLEVRGERPGRSSLPEFVSLCPENTSRPIDTMTFRPFSFLAATIASAATLGHASPLNQISATGLSDIQSLKLSWEVLPSGSAQSFRGLAPVSSKVAWVAGSNATVLRTLDGGASWDSVGPLLTGLDALLEFRDVQAFSAQKAVVLSIGTGSDSRIYVTTDGGSSWDLAFENDNEVAFYNCMDFETPERGLAVSDPVDGKFRLAETLDGGLTWAVVDPEGMPQALEGEFQFSASGTCLAEAAGRWYIASGGIDPGRVFRSENGYDWQVAGGGIAGTPSGGVFSVQFRDQKHGIALGGDFEAPTGNLDNAAYSTDGGETWQSAKKFPSGYRSGSSFVPFIPNVALAVGPTGSDVTIDGGRTWHGFDNGSFHAVECLSPFACWASGAQGRIAKLTI